METTTIKLYKKTKEKLNKFKEYKNESYDEVIKKILYIVDSLDKEPELSKKTLFAIKEARERIKKGDFLTEKEAKKKLGL